MYRFLSVLLLALFSISHGSSNVARLTEGSEYEAHYVRGNIRVECRAYGGWEVVYHTCYADYLMPSSWSRFYIDGFIEADKVTLTATHEDGSTRVKDSVFDAEGQVSKKEFNLWISTLFQRPLLERGLNRIDYELTMGGSPVKTGSFDVVVLSEPARSCYPRSYYTYNMNDCRFPNRYCGEYFYEQNYCY